MSSPEGALSGMSRVPPIDPDEILRHIVEHPDLYAAEWDLDSMDLKDQLLDMKLERKAAE